MSEPCLTEPPGATRVRPNEFPAGRAYWLGPALVMLSAGLFRIGTPELWRDEVSSWSAAGRSVPELLAMLGHVDASNGAYYFFLHGWMPLFGDSAVSLRLPSALAMAGAAAFAALAARRCWDSRVAGAAAGLLLATVPNVSRYAQEARSYAIVTCAVAAATWFLLRALDRPGPGRWAWYCGAMAVAGTFHLVSLTAVVGQLALVLRRADRPGLRQFPLAVLVGVVPAVPVMVLGRQQSGRQLDWLTTPSGYHLRAVWESLFGSSPVLYAFLALAVLALLWRERRPMALRLVLLVVLPVLAVWLISQGGTSFFFHRYLLFTLPGWAMLAGGGVAAVCTRLTKARLTKARLTKARLRRAGWHRPATALAAVAVVAVPAGLGLSAQQQLRIVAAHGDTDYQGAARIVARGYRSGDGLVAVSGDSSWAMVGPGVAYYLPRGVRPQPVFVQRTAVQSNDLFAVDCPEAVACIGNATRVWVVTIGTGGDPYQNLPADQARALRAAFTPAEVRDVRGLTVSMLVRARR